MPMATLHFFIFLRQSIFFWKPGGTLDFLNVFCVQQSRRFIVWDLSSLQFFCGFHIFHSGAQFRKKRIDRSEHNLSIQIGGQLPHRILGNVGNDVVGLAQTSVWEALSTIIEVISSRMVQDQWKPFRLPGLLNVNKTRGFQTLSFIKK